jgi:trk system potassium uptake protein
VGPGMSSVGPTLNYASIPAGGQMVLVAAMLAGRLEFYTLMAIFLPAFWRK